MTGLLDGRKYGKVRYTTRERCADCLKRICLQREGKQVQSVVNMALREFLESLGKPKGRKHVIDAYLKSTQQFDGLYKELAE